MNQATELILSLAAGIALGSICFGGLWLTVKRLNDVTHPWLLMAGSAALRLLIVLGGFWAVGIATSPTGQWQRLAGCLAGFVLARILIIRTVGNGIADVASSETAQ